MAKTRINYKGLLEDMRRDRKVLERFREDRKKAVEQYAGHHWLESVEEQDKTPVNFLDLYLSITSRTLFAKNPRVMYSTWNRQHKAVVSGMQDWVNREIEKIDLADSIQRVVLDALFSIGIMKVSLMTPGESALEAFTSPAGSVLAMPVDLDDFVFDTHARRFSEATYMGHRFRMPREAAYAMFGKRARDLPASKDPMHNVEGDERISFLGRGGFGQDEQEFEEFVDLWEVYLARHGRVLTFSDDQFIGPNGEGDGEFVGPLKEQEWFGHPKGTYIVLSYGIVPGNAMPKGPVQNIVDLSRFGNDIFLKLMRQTKRQKTNILVRGGADADGKRQLDASDGEMIRVDDPQNISEVSRGGANQQNVAMFLETRNLIDFFGGNISTMGGLAVQADTATQEKLLNANSSATIQDKQDRTVKFVQDVIARMSWFYLHDPFRKMTTTYSLPGLPELSIERTVTPEQRQKIKWEDLDVRIDPYSMQANTPKGRLAAIRQFFREDILPTLPLAEQQGLGVDLNAYVAIISELMDEPRVREIIQMREPAAPPVQEEEEEGMGMPAKTERTYNRVSTSERTQKGNDMNMMSALMGVDPGGNPERNGSM